MESYGIALGGGGAKGGYEIGVWKALKELNIPIQIVAGTSVGALNGAIMVQGDFDDAINLWTSISIEDVIKVQKEIASADENLKMPARIVSTIRNAISEGGLDVTPLKNMLQEIIDEKKIRESSIDLGLVTFSLTDFKPMELYKKDIPEGKLIDYLLASSCFPTFKPQKIDDRSYIDGGIYNNIPVSLVANKRVKNIIVVDISGPGVVRKADTRRLNIVYIKNSHDLGGTLDFNGERSKINIEIGYYDTMKAFGKIGGSRYYIMPSCGYENYKEEYFKNLSLDDFKKIYGFLGLEWASTLSSGERLIINKIMRTIRQYAVGGLNGKNILPAMAEITAEQIGLEKIRPYTLCEMTDKILEQYKHIREQEDFNKYIKNIKKLTSSSSQLEFNREVRNIVIEGKFLIYYKPDIAEDDVKVKRLRRFIAAAFPKVSIANMFIAMALERI